jgi:hypothetical protein
MKQQQYQNEIAFFPFSVILYVSIIKTHMQVRIWDK